MHNSNCNLGCGHYISADGKFSFCGDTNRGLACDPNTGDNGCWYVKADMTSVGFNANGELMVLFPAPDACALGVPHHIMGGTQDNTGYHEGETPGPGDTIKSFCTTVVNNDPCGRTMDMTVFFTWAGFAFESPLAGHVDVQFEFSVDGGATWVEETDVQFDSPNGSFNGHCKPVTIVIPPGPITLCGRYRMGATHNAGNVIGRFYNMQINWIGIAGGV